MDPTASRPPSTLAPRDGLAPAPRRAVVAAVLALHVAALWALLQIREVREAVAETAPLFVDLVAPTAPPKPPEPPPPLPPRPVTKAPPPPAPLIAAAQTPSPVAPAFVAPPTPPEPAPPAPLEPPAVVAAPAAPVPPAAPPPAPPKEIPASAIQYLEPPAPVYPRLSRKLNEAGTVLVRVFVDTDGMPRQVQVLQTSGFARLDEAAAAAVLKARFRPYSENGRPVAGWARIPIPFELEN